LVVAIFLPTPPEPESDPNTAVAAQPVAPKAPLMTVASDALSDVSGFCGRQPEVCETAGYFLHKLEAKAKYGVRLLYEWANDDPAAHGSVPYPYRDEAKSDPLTTGSTQALAQTQGEPAESTLTIEDLIPEWRGPGVVKRG
jgi:hypothetical protein